MVITTTAKSARKYTTIVFNLFILSRLYEIMVIKATKFG